MTYSNNPSDIANRADETFNRPSQPSGFNQIKTTVAEKLHSAADALSQKTRQNANQQKEGITNYGNQAADWLHRSADYIHDFDPKRVKSDLQNQVRTNPGRTLLIAGAAGLLLGALLRRR
ncbi:MAG: hypothetical protein AB1757_06600 [Acidobacteriota bacterium]